MAIDKLIAIDVETTGFDRSDDITRNHQIVSIGLIVSDGDFNEIDKLYLEIKWNGTSHWSKQAEDIHGLSKAYLDEYGIEEEEAVVKISEFILKYYDIDEPIVFLGHNPRNFDIQFFKKLTNKFDIYFKIAHRAVDTFSIGFTTLKTNDSNELFELFFPKRGKHNALDDAEMALVVCKKIRKLVNSIL